MNILELEQAAFNAIANLRSELPKLGTREGWSELYALLNEDGKSILQLSKELSYIQIVKESIEDGLGKSSGFISIFDEALASNHRTVLVELLEAVYGDQRLQENDTLRLLSAINDEMEETNKNLTWRLLDAESGRVESIVAVFELQRRAKILEAVEDSVEEGALVSSVVDRLLTIQSGLEKSEELDAFVLRVFSMILRSAG